MTLSGRWLRIDVVAETGSTNADLVAGLKAGDAIGRVLVSEHQSAGRGRRGRSWTAAPGTSVALSATVAPAADPRRWTWLPLLTGLAVAEGLSRLAPGLGVGLKWPNDVLVGDRKLAGILAERVDRPGAGPACVLGIGINTTMTADQLPVPTATSLALELGDRAPAAIEVVESVLDSISSVLSAWEAEPGVLAARYRQRCTTLGREVVVQLAADRRLQGQATGVDRDGCLVVDVGGEAVVVGAGDVVHVRGATPGGAQTVSLC